ncbi:MAG: phosphate signaling complex protein PhoU [Rhizobiales bacterium]|nr:phosphate signaling complex protein PhoU [Hyphomicrobiales bacterium]
MDHTVRAYTDELNKLDHRIAKMGGLAEMLLANSFEALEKRDAVLAQSVIDRDVALDAGEQEVEEQVITLIARRQPLAVDLRHVMCALKVAAELERIGDLSKNVAKRAIAVASESHPKALISGLRHMNELAQVQLKNVLDAYAQRDLERARIVWQRDADIDLTFNSVFRELLTYMMEDPRNIGLCTHLLFGAKNLERVGDHCTNIAEMVHFMVSGTMLPDGRPKSDRTSSTLLPSGE